MKRIIWSITALIWLLIIGFWFRSISPDPDLVEAFEDDSNIDQLFQDESKFEQDKAALEELVPNLQVTIDSEGNAGNN